MKKIGLIGDLHMRENLSYSSSISDGRVSEKKEILDFIVKSFSDCGSVVLLGDCFNSKNPAAETIKEFVAFIESFGGKDVYIISGNHSKKGDGSTSLDFLKEVKNKPHWHIMTSITSCDIKGISATFLPYMLKGELGTENDEQPVEKIIKDIQGGDILFAHHSISDTTFNGISTNSLKEVVLPKIELEKKYKQIITGHIHVPGVFGKTILAGSVFNQEVGENEKFIWKVDDTLKVEQIKLPGRGIYKMVDPTSEELAILPKESIVKVILTDKKISMEEIKSNLTRFDASLILEQYPDERKKMNDVQKNGAMDFSPEALLKLYSEERGVELSKLLKGFELINVHE